MKIGEVFEVKCSAFEKKGRIHRIMKACKRLISDVNSSIYDGVYYNAERSEIYATNGNILLVFKTNEISNVFGQLEGTYILDVMGPALCIRPLKTSSLKYEKLIDEYDSIRTNSFETLGCVGRKTSSGYLFMAECAYSGRLVSSECVSIVEKFSGEFDSISWNKKEKGAILLSGNSACLLVLPITGEEWLYRPGEYEMKEAYFKEHKNLEAR